LEAALAAGLEAALAAGLEAALATGLVLVAGLEILVITAFVFFAAAFGAGEAGFLTTAFFTGVVLVAFGLAVGFAGVFAAFFGLALIGLAFDAGFAVVFAADFLAEFLEGISSFAAEERDM
jgi:hypothetical protein